MCKVGNRLRPLPQRREVDWNYRQPIVKVLAELTRLHRCTQVDIRSRNDPDVYLRGGGPSQTPDLTFLQCTKQLHLQGGGEFPDFIEKQCSPLRRLKQPGPIIVGPGERSTHIPEELGLEEGFGDGTTVDRNKRFVGPVAFAMDQPSHQLLSRTRLPGKQHGRPMASDFRRRLESPNHGR